MLASYATSTASYPPVTSPTVPETRDRISASDQSEAAPRQADSDADVWPWVRLPDGRLELGLEVA